MANPEQAYANSRTLIDASKNLPTKMRVIFPTADEHGTPLAHDDGFTLSNLSTAYDAYEVVIPAGQSFVHPNTGLEIAGDGTTPHDIIGPDSNYNWTFDAVNGNVWRITTKVQADELHFQVYKAGLTYPPNVMAMDAGWVGVSKVFTAERPAPIYSMSPSFLLPDPPNFTDQTQPTTSYSGVRIVVGSDTIQALGVRFWVPEIGPLLTHRGYAATKRSGDSVFQIAAQFDLSDTTEVGWVSPVFRGNLYFPGDEIQIWIQTIKSTGSDSQWNATWQLDEGNNPPDENKMWRNGPLTQLKYNIIDTNDGNQGSNLALVKVGDEIENRENNSRWNRYVVDGVSTQNGGDVYVFDVTRIDNGNTVRDGRDIDATFFIKSAPANSPYVELTNYWADNLPPTATINGFAVEDFDDVDTSLDGNAYGVDLIFATLGFSDHWQYVTHSPLADPLPIGSQREP